MEKTEREVQQEETQAKPKRKSRKKAQPDFPAPEPVALSEPLAALVEKYDLKPASQILQQLEPPEPLRQLTDARQTKSLIDTPSQPEQPKKPDETDPSPERNGHVGKEKPTGGNHAAAVLANRQGFRPVAAGFMNVDSYPPAGIKVNKSLDRQAVAVQFAEDRTPTREEKDTLEIAGLSYHPGRKHWERIDPEEPGANLVDAKRIAAEMSRERVGRAR